MVNREMKAMSISMDEVKALRAQTGISVMQCKKALEEADGDAEKALVLLRKKSGAAAAKKADRELGAGAVQAYVHASGDIGAMVLLSCETDFVSKNDEFKQLAYDIAMHAAATNPHFIKREQVTPEDLAKAREVFEDEAKDKPQDKREMIVEGKLKQYLDERVLLQQPFVKDQERTIGQLIEEAVQKFGERVEVSECVRLSARD